MTGLTPTLIGTTKFVGTNTDATNPLHFTMAIPAGAQVGDLLVASIMTADAAVDPGRGLDRLYRNAWGSYNFGLWAGYWDGDTTPIPWQGAGYNNSTGQYFAAFLSCFRDRFDYARPLVYALGPTVPGLPSSGPAISVNWSRSGISGTGAFRPYQGTDWTEADAVDGSYVRGAIALHADTVADETATGSPSAAGSDINGPYMSMGLDGMGLAPPCRVYPREDQLGVGSGRIWPQPRSHQASPRRAGGFY